LNRVTDHSVQPAVCGRMRDDSAPGKHK
jgi:hypothetical protein